MHLRELFVNESDFNCPSRLILSTLGSWALTHTRSSKLNGLCFLPVTRSIISWQDRRLGATEHHWSEWKLMSSDRGSGAFSLAVAGTLALWDAGSTWQLSYNRGAPAALSTSPCSLTAYSQVSQRWSQPLLSIFFRSMQQFVLFSDQLWTFSSASLPCAFAPSRPLRFVSLKPTACATNNGNSSRQPTRRLTNHKRMRLSGKTVIWLSFIFQPLF